MTQQSFFNQAGKQFMQAVLHSPFHRLLSGGTVLVTVTGRKSGKQYTTPVNYLRQADRLRIVSLRDRTWWRNLRGGAPLTLYLQGQEVQGWGEVIEDDEAVAAELAAHVAQAPQYARYFAVSFDGDGLPTADSVKQAAQSRVVIRVNLVGMTA